MIKCKYKFQDKEKFQGKPYCICFSELCEDIDFVCDKNCQIYEDYKKLEKIKKIAADTLSLVDYKTYFKRDNKSLKQEGFKGLKQIIDLIERGCAE